MPGEPVGDRDLLAFRREYYEILVALLWKEPPPDLLRALAEGIGGRARAAARLHPLLGEGWSEIERWLARVPPDDLGEALVDEYTRLFLGPPAPEVNLYESYYLTGRVWDRPLAEVRASLVELGLEKEPGYAEPEDALAFELEVVRRLILRQAEARVPDQEVRWANGQATFLKRHLLVWGPAAARDLAQARSAVFYRGVARLLEGFLDTERELYERWGDEVLRSLEEARAGFARVGEWQGPLFDPGGGGEKSGQECSL